MLRQVRQSSGPLTPHCGGVELGHSFIDIYNWLREKNSVALQTDARIAFEARSGIERDGRLMVRFFRRGQEYGRVYACCWGRYYNCHRIPVANFCTTLDRALAS
jgi:hypothetical protein